MSEFRIKVARIERSTDQEAAPQVCLTFRLEREDVDFQIPVRLNVIDYDDTEMVQVARGVLNQLVQRPLGANRGLETFSEIITHFVKHECAPKTPCRAR